jgi:hypothetical protein
VIVEPDVLSSLLQYVSSFEEFIPDIVDVIELADLHLFVVEEVITKVL